MSDRTANVLLYRLGDQGLEIFLVPNQEGAESWDLPLHPAAANYWEATPNTEEEHVIQLDTVRCDRTQQDLNAIALEVPENEDQLPLVDLLGEQESPLKIRRRTKMLLDHGAYFCAKEAVKKVFPAQVKMIKELQEVVSSRNLLRYI
ncbi:MAG: hypothetical protein AAF598_12930 [Bacteroidota bacterium]